MKKLTPLVILAAFGAMTFASCKKDYTCTCTLDGETIGTYKFTKVKKKDAKTACENWDNSVKLVGGSCSL